jgi:hypothetical protein
MDRSFCGFVQRLAWGAGGRSSFLKKRSKKLLSVKWYRDLASGDKG